LWTGLTGFDNGRMSDPIDFYRSFQGLLRGRGIAAVLTSGMACVEYGLQQNTKDTDWIVAPADIGRLVALFGAPLDPEYLASEWPTAEPAELDGGVDRG